MNGMMKDRVEDLALKAVIGATLVAIVGLASIHMWALSKGLKNE